MYNFENRKYIHVNIEYNVVQNGAPGSCYVLNSILTSSVMLFRGELDGYIFLVPQMVRALEFFVDPKNRYIRISTNFDI